jgi:hypothetical protein
MEKYKIQNQSKYSHACVPLNKRRHVTLIYINLYYGELVVLSSIIVRSSLPNFYSSNPRTTFMYFISEIHFFVRQVGYRRQ